MIYIIKEEGLNQNKVNSSLVFTCNCKMGYSCIRAFYWTISRSVNGKTLQRTAAISFDGQISSTLYRNIKIGSHCSKLVYSM